MRKRYQICFVKKRLRQADTNTIISQKNAWKEINGFSKNKNRQWETIWWRVSRQRIKSEDRSKNEQFHFRQQKTKDKHDIFTNMKDKFFEVSALKSQPKRIKKSATNYNYNNISFLVVHHLRKQQIPSNNYSAFTEIKAKTQH